MKLTTPFHILTLAAFVAIALPASAAQLVYRPSFSDVGSPNFFSSLSNQGALSRPEAPASASNSLTTRSLAQSVQSSVALGIATNIQSKLLSSSSAPSGTFSLGDGSVISYTTQGSIRTITFTDLSGTTTISIPLN